MRYLVSLFICASLLLSGCITGRTPLGEGVSSQNSKTTQKATFGGARTGQGSISRLAVSEVARGAGPESGSSSDTAQWDRF
jgi:hypothetical protein